MVNVDELNENIKKFGVVIEKVEELPDVYQGVKEQLELEKKNIEAITELEQKQEKHYVEVIEKLKTIEKNAESKLQEVGKNAEVKLDKAEINLRDRIALLESNTTLAINELKTSMESQIVGVKEKADEESKVAKTRFTVLAAGIMVIIVLQIIV